MAASSVTGTGQGDSNGLYKPQNNGSCGCTSPISTDSIPLKRQKKGCVSTHRYGVKSVRYGAGSNGIKVNSCF